MISLIYIIDKPCAYLLPFASATGTTGIGTGPPGESAVLAVNISTPSAVTRSVCSEEC